MYKPKKKNESFKSYSVFDLATIKPKTETQKSLFHAYNTNANLMIKGSAGTGKTFLALYLALREVLEGKYRQVVIIRSSVASRDIGHLPGTLDEKLQVYEDPYRYILGELFPNKQDPYTDLLASGFLEFTSTSFIRGKTYDNCIMIVDEAQNCSLHELDSVITRVGRKTKIMFCGDSLQTDLLKSKNDVSGLEQFCRILDRMDQVCTIVFSRSDIVRSGLVKSYIIAKEEMYER